MRPTQFGTHRVPNWKPFPEITLVNENTEQVAKRVKLAAAKQKPAAGERKQVAARLKRLRAWKEKVIGGLWKGCIKNPEKSITIRAILQLKIGQL